METENSNLEFLHDPGMKTYSSILFVGQVFEMPSFITSGSNFMEVETLRIVV